jgi:hypothetical protein
MNNTTIKTLPAIAAILIAVILVVATFATTTTATQSAFAYAKNKGDNKKDGGNGNGNTITIQKCKQAATQSGWDNNQEQECENLICTHPGENATCVSEGTAAAATAGGGRASTIAACVACFTNSGLIDTQINILLERAGAAVGSGPLTLEQLCALLENGTISVAVLTDILNGIPLVSQEKITAIITCLTNAGTLSPGAGR